MHGEQPGHTHRPGPELVSAIFPRGVQWGLTFTFEEGPNGAVPASMNFMMILTRNEDLLGNVLNLN